VKCRPGRAPAAVPVIRRATGQKRAEDPLAEPSTRCTSVRPSHIAWVSRSVNRAVRRVNDRLTHRSPARWAGQRARGQGADQRAASTRVRRRAPQTGQPYPRPCRSMLVLRRAANLFRSTRGWSCCGLSSVALTGVMVGGQVETSRVWSGLLRSGVAGGTARLGEFLHRR
jgi:hypothetical protein